MEVKPNVKPITKIEIRGLWGKYDIQWAPNPDVNILIGINGSGKTTLLKLLIDILNQNSHLIFDVCKEYVNLFDNGRAFFLSEDGFGNNYYAIEGDERWDVIVNYIDTFDTDLKNLEAIKQLSNDKIKTNLDWELWQLEKYYFNYQITLGKRIEKVVFETIENNIIKRRDEIYKKKNIFINTINRLFSKTNKVITTDEKDNSIIFLQGDTKLTPYQLSSGEKQILIILLRVLLQDNQPSILLMDEPEISLHLEWQHQLIGCIQSLNGSCQIIIATHSPSIFAKGWFDKIVRMEDILKKTTWSEDELPF